MPTEADYWNSLARYGVDAAVIDPLDRLGFKNAYITGLRTAVLRAQLATLPDDALVLDLGCGTGALLRDLNTAGHRTVGLDIAEQLLRDSRTRFGGPPPAAAYDGSRFPLPSGRFAAACTYVVLNHITDETQLCRVLQEVWRVLMPGGRLLAIEQIRQHSRQEPHRHSFRRSPQDWQQLFTRCGFTVAPPTVLRYGHNPLIYAIRYGLLPSSLLLALSRYERRVAAWWGTPRFDYADTLFVAIKPSAE